MLSKTALTSSSESFRTEAIAVDTPGDVLLSLLCCALKREDDAANDESWHEMFGVRCIWDGAVTTCHGNDFLVKG